MKNWIKKQASVLGIVAVLASSAVPVSAQDHKYTDKELLTHLEEIAVVEQKLLVPMRDGVGLSTDVYRPKNAKGKLPTIFWRTPYNYNEMFGTRLTFVHEAVKRGYAFVIQNERGRYFSEGEWEILGYPRTDGYDALDWIAAQPWSNGKVGTIGCSSSAEWQLALAAQNHPAHAAMIPMASGAGIGRVGDWYEQGSWYRGGVFQMLFATWLYAVQNDHRPQIPQGLSAEERVRIAKYFDLDPNHPKIDWGEKLKHLPLTDLLENVDGLSGPYEDMIARTPNDPKWYEGGLYHDNEDWGVPAFWMNSWYDVSMGPNLALAEHIKNNASDREVRDNQYVLIAPTLHCGFYRITDPLVVGERDMGDVKFGLNEQIYGWFDYWLKGEKNKFPKKTPKVQYYAMGANEWRGAESWPPKGVENLTLYLDKGDHGSNSLFGDGKLATSAPSEEETDNFTYDPMNPVPSLGGGICCIGGAVEGGSFDQRSVEARHDVLVYTSDPLGEDTDVTGWIETVLYVASDAKDTDFTIKLVDVYPDGRAFNIDQSIQRARYREGYQGDPVFMQDGEVYELKIGPMVTSNVFKKGHRIRVEISSSNFPQFARNLNTGGNNYDESEGVVAHNVVHMAPNQPSRIVLPILKK